MYGEKKFFSILTNFAFINIQKIQKLMQFIRNVDDCVIRMTTFPLDVPIPDGAMVQVEGTG